MVAAMSPAGEAGIALGSALVGVVGTVLVERSRRKEQKAAEAAARRDRVIQAVGVAIPLLRQVDSEIFSLMSEDDVRRVVSGLIDAWNPVHDALVSAATGVPRSDAQLIEQFVDAANHAMTAPAMLVVPEVRSSQDAYASAVADVRTRQNEALALAEQVASGARR
jgi:hypothetical protein